MSDFIKASEKIISEIREDASDKALAAMPMSDVPTIRDEGHADSIVRLLVELEAEKERIEQAAAMKLGRIEDRIKSVRYVWENALRDWAKARLAEDKKGKRKSVVLDNGVLGFRTLPAKTVTESEAELLKWAEVNCVDAVTYHPRVSVTVVADWEAKNKTLAPGRRACEAEERFKIALPKIEEEKEKA